MKYVEVHTLEVVECDDPPERKRTPSGDFQVWVKVPEDATELVKTVIRANQEQWETAAKQYRGLLTTGEAFDHILVVGGYARDFLMNS